jgi:hypothetical protein
MDDIKLSMKIGDFKLEKHGICNVKNAMEVTWD